MSSINICLSGYIILSTFCGYPVDKHVSPYVFSLMRILCFWLNHRNSLHVDTCFHFIHMPADFLSDYCKLTDLYKVSSTHFSGLSTAFSPYSHFLHEKSPVSQGFPQPHSSILQYSCLNSEQFADYLSLQHFKIHNAFRNASGGSPHKANFCSESFFLVKNSLI